MAAGVSWNREQGATWKKHTDGTRAGNDTAITPSHRASCWSRMIRSAVRFLRLRSATLPVEVDVAVTCAAALQLAKEHDHQLWLIDANLPDGNGRDLLRALRVNAPTTQALAHTASRDRSDLDALIDAGFAEVLIKPLGAVELQAAVRRALQLQPGSSEAKPRPCGKLPIWDDAAAASALNGNHAHAAALRRLFLGELPTQRDAVLSALRADDIRDRTRPIAPPAGELRLRRCRSAR